MMASPKHPCTHCGKATVRLQSTLGIPLCGKCEKGNPALYKYITAGTAKADYAMNEVDLAELDCLEVRNPHYRSGAPMRLYLLSQILAYRPPMTT